MDMYLIQSETLTANANTIRDCLDSAVYYMDPGILSDKREITWIEEGNVNVYYREFVDYSDAYSQGMQNIQDMQNLDKTIIAYSYAENDDGNIVPVLYWTSLEYNPDPDTREPLYYIGQETIDDVIYDKWRKIDGNGFSWDNYAKYYIYTDIIVNNNGIVNIAPQDFPRHIRAIASSTGGGSSSNITAEYDEATQTLTITTN